MPLHNRTGNEAKRSSVELRSLIDGFRFGFSEKTSRRIPRLRHNDLRGSTLTNFFPDYDPQSIGRFAFVPSPSRSLAGSTHICRASIRTLNGPLWARCKLGSDLKPRSVTIGTDLGCWVLPSLERSSWTSTGYAVTRTRRWMSLPAKPSGYRWFFRAINACLLLILPSRANAQFGQPALAISPLRSSPLSCQSGHAVA